MALFGGGGGGASKTKITRPDYVNALINNITQGEKNTQLGDYTDIAYQGLDAQGQQYLQNLMNNTELTGAANQLMGMGQEGLTNLNDYYNQIAQVYNQTPTMEDVNNLATRLYSGSDVQNQINAENQLAEENYALGTAPDIAQQTNEQGYGSGGRVAREMAKRGLARSEQANSDQISSQAYQNAVEQANSILSGQQTNRRAALNALGSNIGNQVGALNQAQQLQEQAQNNAYGAALTEQQQAQAFNDLAYKNKTYAQNWENMDIDNRLKLAQSINQWKGQTTTQKTTGGGGQGVLGGALGGKLIMLPLRVIAMIKNFSNCWKLSLGYKYAIA